MRQNFLHWFTFCIALGVLFVAGLILFGMIEVEHKGRVVLLVLLAFAVIYMNFKSSKKEKD